jgi:hypothetical protein
MAKQDTLFPLDGPRLDPDTVRRLRAMLDETEELTCKITIAVVHKTESGLKNKYAATLELPTDFVAALLDTSEAAGDMDTFATLVRDGRVSVSRPDA